MTTYTAADVNAWYLAVQFRDGPQSEVDAYVIQLNNGSTTPNSVQQQIIQADYTLAYVNPVIELYQGLLNRVPLDGGLNYYADLLASGTPDYVVAFDLGSTAEFTAYYGAAGSDTISAATLSLMFRTVLGREPAQSGIDYWLETGLPNWQVAYYISSTSTAASNMSLAINSFQQAQIAGTEATTGSIYQYGGIPTSAQYLTTNIETLPITDLTTVYGTVANSGSTLQAGDAINAPTNSVTTNLNITDVATGAPGAVTTSNFTLNNVRNVTVTNLDESGNDHTYNMALATGTTTVGISGSDNNSDTIFSNLKNLVNGSIANGSGNLEQAYQASVVSGSANAIGLTVNGAATGTGEVATFKADGIETINVSSQGFASGSVGSNGLQDGKVSLTGNALKTVNISGSQQLVATTALSGAAATGSSTVGTVDASKMTGVLDLDITGAGGSYLSLKSGSGADTFRITTRLSDNTSIDGGLGVDTLVTTFAAAAGLTSVNGVNGIDALSLSTALNGALNSQTVDSTIGTVTVNVAGAAGALTDAASTVTGGAGTFVLNLGTTAVGNAANLDAALTVADTGTGTADAVQIWNKAVNSTTGSTVDVFGGQAVTSTGYENVVISTGTPTGSGTATAQTISTLTITPDVASANVSLTAIGVSPLSVTSLSTSSTGLTTINASGLTPATAASAGLTLNGFTLGSAGTASITGTGGVDAITLGNFASTVLAAAGNDTITGGTVGSSIDGGSGNDTINNSGGNDTLRGNDGADTINANTNAATVSIDGGAGNDRVDMGSTLAANDSVDGGADIDTFAQSSSIISAVSNVSNFEILEFTQAQTQDISLFASNSGWTTVNAVTGANAVTNAVAALATANIDNDVTTFTLSRASGVTGGALTAQALQDEDTTFALVNNSDATINFAQGALKLTNANDDQLTVSALTATSATAVNITGGQATSVTLASNGFGTSASTVNVNASSATGTVVFDATNQTNSSVSINVTGSSTKANTLSGGAGNDSLTGGSVASTLYGNDGNDILSGGAAGDQLFAGNGNDTVNSAAGTDSITAGNGADTVNLTVDSAIDVITQRISDSNTATLTSFAGATVAAGDSLTYANSLDIVNNFLAGTGGDQLAVVASGSPTSLIGATVENLSSSNTVFYASGSYNSVTGRFTISANGTGADTLIVQSTGSGASDSLTTNANALVLVGVNSASFVAGNFVAAATTVYTLVGAAVVTGTTGEITGIAGYPTATSLVNAGYTAINSTTGLLTVNLGGSAAQTFLRSTGAVTGADNGSVNQLAYTQSAGGTLAVNFGSGSDVYTTNSLAAGVTVNGGTGVDQIVYSGGAATIDLGTIATATNFENIDASAVAAADVVNITTVAGTTSVVAATATGADITMLNTATATVNVSAVATGSEVEVKGSAAGAVEVTGIQGTLTATNLTTATLKATLIDDASDAITVITGDKNTTVTGASATDAVTITATALDDGQTLTIENSTAGAGSITVGALVANITNSATGAQNINVETGDVVTITANNAGAGDMVIDAYAMTTGTNVLTVNRSGSGSITVTGDNSGTLTGFLGEQLINEGTGTSLVLGNITTNLTNTGTGAIATDAALTVGKTITTAGTYGGVGDAFTFTKLLSAVTNASTGNVNITDVDSPNGSLTLTQTGSGSISVNAADLIGGTDTLVLAGTGTTGGITITGLDTTLTTTFAGTGLVNITSADASFTFNNNAASKGASFDLSLFGDGKAITIADTGVTGGLITINNLGLGDVVNSTYGGAVNVTAVGGSINVTQVIETGAAASTVNASQSASLMSITGGAGNDTLTGGTSADTINGGAGNDTIVTGNGNNLVNGGNGSDTITLGTGNDNIQISAVKSSTTLWTDAVTGFQTSGVDVQGFSIDDLDVDGTTALTLSNGNGADYAAAIAVSGLAFASLAANNSVNAATGNTGATAFDVVKLSSTTADSWATALGTGTITVANMDGTEGLLTMWYNSVTGTANIGIIQADSAETAITSADAAKVQTVGTFLMTSTEYGNFTTSGLYLF